MPRLFLRMLLPVFTVLTAKAPAQEAVAATPAYRASYVEIRTWHEQQYQLDLTRDQRVENLRSVVKSRLGNRGLERVFGNFVGHRSIDPMIPGIERTVLLGSSSNTNVAKGHRRTVLYSTKLHHDPRFLLLALNEEQRNAAGRMITDKDIRYQHRATGGVGRIEVKEVTAQSQRANLAKYQVQLDKMAVEYRRTGELQAWVNRRDVIPELREYARQRGIPVFENVVTGQKNAQMRGKVPFEDVLRTMNARHRAVGVSRQVGGGAQIGFGALLVYQSFPGAIEDYRLLTDPVHRDLTTVTRFGERASLIASGAAGTLSGSANLATAFTTNTQRLGVLNTIGRAGGGVAVAAFLAAEGLTVTRYARGDLTDRQFWVGQTSLVAGLGGGAGGAWLGAEAGVWIGGCVAGPFGALVGSTVGAIAGGIGGGYAGSSIAERGMHHWFELQDAKQADDFRQFVYALYHVP